MSPAPSPLALWLLVLLACGLDRLVGDPLGCPHPVQAMGWLIVRLRRGAEAWAGDRPGPLRLAGGLITLVLVGGSAVVGGLIEQGARLWPLAGIPLLLIALSSALAGRSLEQRVEGVLNCLDSDSGDRLERARRQLAWIVGRDVDGLGEAEILRAAAETAAENGVDGLFGPLFWILVGAGLFCFGGQGPGPLALGWAYKAASTLDSMLGYRQGRLRWLGTAGARLDDLLTWLPCRLVAISLPLVSPRPGQLFRQLTLARRQGQDDPSPNAGLSLAAYAQAAEVKLGGTNNYGGVPRAKPILGRGFPPADRGAVERILQLSRRLEMLWLAISLLVAVLLLMVL